MDKTFKAERIEQCETAEPIMPPIVEKTEEEKEMVANLRADFREWQQKRLNEANEVGLSTKKQKTSNKKGSSSKLTIPPFFMLIPPSSLVLKENDVESIPFHKQGEMVTILSDDFTPNAQPLPIVHADVPS